MASPRRYLRCCACGRLGPAETILQRSELPPTAMLQLIGGRAMCRWDPAPLTVDEALTLEANLKHALAQVRAAIAAAGQD